MTGMFDSVLDSVGSLFGTSGSTIGTGIKAAGKVLLDDSKKSSTSGNSDTLSALERGLRDLGIANNFNAKTPEGAPVSVNPDSLDAQWRSRLNRFAEIQSNTGVKGA